MALNWASNKKYVYWGIAIVILIILVLWYFYSRGKKAGSYEQAPLPNDAPGGAKLQESEKKEVREMSGKLKTELDKWFAFDEDVLQEFITMSDKLFVAVFNDFNNIFKKDYPEGLRDAIETAYLRISGEKKDMIEKKMNRLNINFIGK